MARAPSKSTFTASERTESQVRLRVLSDRGWVGDRADCIGDVGTDAHDSAAVLADGFRRNCGSRPPFSAAQTPRPGCCRRDGNECRLRGHHNGHSSDKNAIETPYGKLRQCAVQRAAEGLAGWLAHRLQILPRLRAKWANRQRIARE